MKWKNEWGISATYCANQTTYHLVFTFMNLRGLGVDKRALLKESYKNRAEEWNKYKCIIVYWLTVVDNDLSGCILSEEIFGN